MSTAAVADVAPARTLDPTIEESDALKAACAYTARGLKVLPLAIAKKNPTNDNGVHGASCDPDQLAAWFSYETNIGVAVPPGVVVVDVDPRNGGDTTFAAWNSEHGTDWYPGSAPKQLTGGGGWHIWFKYDGRKLVKNPGEGVDLLTEGRYVVVAPSRTTDGYRWSTKLPADLADLPTLPDWLLDLATPAAKPVASAPVRSSADSDVDELSKAAHKYTTWEALLTKHGWTFFRGSKWRHPETDNDSSATITNDCLFVYSPNTDFPVTEPGDRHGVTLFRAISILEHDGDHSTTSSALRDAGFLTSYNTHIDFRAMIGREPTSGNVWPVLPDAFWSARPIFQHIRTAARSRLIAPDGVFAALLMWVAALTDFRIVLPDVVGRYGSLNSVAVLVAASGGGKGSSVDTARDLIQPDLLNADRFKEAPIGSGEGMVIAFFRQTKTKDADNKAQTLWEQRFDSIAFRIDEGEMLKSLAERSGQTTMSMLRSAWSGERLGNSYADREKRGLILPQHGYRASLIMGVQPELARFLLDDAIGGTPQRFLWATLIDPGVPNLADLPSWPGPLDWRPPDWHDGELVSISGYQRTAICVASSISDAIRQHRLDITRGEVQPDPLDSHADLVQLKTAGLLAVLDGRLDIADDDWNLAADVCDVSRRVRAWVQEKIRAAADAAESGSIARSARRAIAVEAAKASTHSKVERVADTITRKVIAGGDGGITPGRLRAAITSRDRDIIGPAVANAGESDLVVLRDGRYYPGSQAK
jgi:hypothetical protein